MYCRAQVLRLIKLNPGHHGSSVELVYRQSDLLKALNYTKEDLLVGCPVVKDFHVRKKHVLFKNVFKVNKLSNFVSYQSCSVVLHEKNMSYKIRS